MDVFEKKQTIEAVKTVVKARWFVVILIFSQGLILKIFAIPLPLATTPYLTFIFFNAFLFNFLYWFYLRRPIKKISNFGLQTVKIMQVITDMVLVSLILYFSGTISKMIIILYFVSIMIGATLYRKKGVIFSLLFAQFLFTILIILQFKGLMKPTVPTKEVFGMEFSVGDKNILYFLLIAFYSYSGAVAVFAGYLATFFKKREKSLKIQNEALIEKTQTLIKTKNELHKSLIRSEIAKKAALQAREEMERANIELKKKMEELEKFYQMTIGREVRILGLKEKIKELEKKLKEKEQKIKREEDNKLDLNGSF